jgi:hypothetical protein
MGRDEEGHGEKRRKHSHSEEYSDEKRSERLPYNAKPLTKHDMDEYKEIFAEYLLDRKDIKIEEISSKEAYARFKSFVHKW